MVSGGYTGPEHHTGIIMDTGQGRVSAGQLGTAPTSHWISFFVLQQPVPAVEEREGQFTRVEIIRSVPGPSCRCCEDYS